VKPLWTLPGSEIVRILDKHDKEREREKKWDSSPIGKFITLANKQFPCVYDCYRHYQHKALVHYETGPDFDEYHSAFAAPLALIRLIYVIRKARGQGIALSMLHSLVSIADQTACALIAISHPFERTGNDDSETIDSAARQLSNSVFPISVVSDSDYYRLQKRMSERFQLAGFKSIALPELTKEDSRMTPENCLIYIPEDCERDFVESIEHRLQ